MDDRHQSFIVLYGVVDLLAANVGGYRIKTDHKHKGIGSLDATFDLLPPIRREWNRLPIYPGFAILRSQRIVQLLDKELVFARVGDKNVTHWGTGGFSFHY